MGEWGEMKSVEEGGETLRLCSLLAAISQLTNLYPVLPLTVPSPMIPLLEATNVPFSVVDGISVQDCIPCHRDH